MVNKAKIKIRNVKKEDIESIVDIQIDDWRTAYKSFIDGDYLIKLDKKEKIEKRKKDYNENGFIVAVIENEVVGYCRYIDSNKFSKEYENIDCELCALYVKSSLKRNGIGRELMQYVINEFRNKGKKKMILWCFKENYSSRAFYEKMGGKVFKYKVVEYGGKEYKEVSYLYDIEKL